MSKNLINISDLNKIHIHEIIDISKKIEENTYKEDLKRKKIGLIFEKPSTRTRLSFITGIYELNGIPIEINMDNLNISRNESFIDTIKMFNLYLDCLIFRTNQHNKLKITSEYFDKPVINALSEISHPCQILSDYLTLKEIFNKENLIISWFGDTNNVLYSLIELATILDEITVNVFTNNKILEDNFSINKLKNIHLKNEICKETIKKSDCIMTDVYNSTNDEFSQTKKDLLLPFQVNSEIMSYTKDDSVFMHCLPANVGEEVTEEVINSNKSVVLKQAYNRKVLQKGLISWLGI